MKISHNGARWVAVASFDERGILKAAGMRWDKDARHWWTGDMRVAGAFRAVCDDAATQALDRAGDRHTEALSASRAASADVDIPCPDGLAYLPYQRAGIAYALARTNCLIGDEMGLGKTIQAIGVANTLPAEARILVICPASLKLNWAREFARWSVCGHKPAIINYDVLKREHDALRAQPWDLLILDEAHYCKSPKAQRTVYALGGSVTVDREKRIIKRIPAARTIALTGTPMVNRPIELWPLVKTLDPTGLGGNWKHYVTRYCAGECTAYGWDVSGASNLPELQEQLRASIMVRRLKADVLTELPAKRRSVLTLQPDATAQKAIGAELAAYERNRAAIERLQVAIELAKCESDEAYQAAVARLRSAMQIEFTEISKLRHETALAKLPAFLDLLESYEGQKVIVFAHHKDVVQAISERAGVNGCQITGDTSMTDRQAAVDRFQTDPTCTLIVGTIGAMGVGLTLTASSTVLFAELDWVPGNISQAEDRAHRIGQHDSVSVVHVVLDGSLDAHMAHTLIAKQTILDQSLDNEGGAIEPLVLNIPEPTVSAPVTPHAPAQTIAPSPSRARIAQAALIITPEQITAAHTAMRILAGSDMDRAQVRNGVGFSRIDGMIGHDLADRQTLSPKQGALAAGIARKYRRQLPEDIVKILNGETAHA